jgi:nitrite reductase/ring-hydroxylating ferredoxin subunit
MCVAFEGEQVALFNVDGTIYAISDSCTHVGGQLSQGEVEGTIVTCPLHGATFDLTTGSAESPPADEAVTSYQVQVEGDEIQVATR